MDALRIKTLEEDNAFLRGQVQLLQARNSQLEARIAELSAFIPGSKGIASVEIASTTPHSLSGDENGVDDRTFPQSEESDPHTPMSADTPTAASVAVAAATAALAGEAPVISKSNEVGSISAAKDVKNHSYGPSIDTRAPLVQPPLTTTTTTTPLTATATPNTPYDPPPTPRPTPTEAHPRPIKRSSSGSHGPAPPPSDRHHARTSTIGSIAASAAASLNRMRSKTIAGTPTPPPLPLPPSKLSSSHGPSTSRHHRQSSTGQTKTNGTRYSPGIPQTALLQIIFRYATYNHSTLPCEDPFFTDSTMFAWEAAVRLLKTVCLVSRAWHASAIPCLYGSIRLRRIPQLSALVSTLEQSAAQSMQQIGTSSSWGTRPYGSYTTALDLSFYIPPEWNNLYAEDVRRLIACTPNLASYRSRPMLPTLGPRPVPSGILLSLADTRSELLSELELSEQEGAQIPDLVRLLQNCTYLEKLRLGKYVFDGGLPTNTPVLRLPSLKILEIKVTNRVTPGSFASIPSPHLLAEAAKWDLPVLEELILVLFDEIKVPFSALNPFLNIHGHKVERLTLKDANPLMRNPPLQVSGVLSRCPNLREVSIVGSCTAPLVLARPHNSLERVRFLGVAPGSRRESGADAGMAHLLAMRVDNLEARRKLPMLKEVVLQGEADPFHQQALVFLWQDAVGPDVVIILEGLPPLPPDRTATLVPAEGDEDDEDEDQWLPDEDSDSEDEEDRYWENLEDDDKSDDETVRDSRSGRGKDDDQIDHTAALLIFHDSNHRRPKWSFGPSSSKYIGNGTGHGLNRGSVSGRMGSVDVKRTSMGNGSSSMKMW